MPAVTPEPVLDVDEPTGPPRAIVLVLHGGRANGTGPTRARQLAVVRMRPFVSALRHAGADAGLVVARMRYLVRGWNGSTASPVPDVTWALDRLAERFPGVPVALVGHSMGGRAAVYAGGHPSVKAVVGLAPWLEPGDPFAQLARRRLLFVHGDLDRMTSPAESARFLQRSARIAASASYIAVHRERHAMLRRARVWHELTAGYVLAVMCGIAPEGTVGRETANVVGKALAGESTLIV